MIGKISRTSRSRLPGNNATKFGSRVVVAVHSIPEDKLLGDSRVVRNAIAIEIKSPTLRDSDSKGACARVEIDSGHFRIRRNGDIRYTRGLKDCRVPLCADGDQLAL